jgi:transposase
VHVRTPSALTEEALKRIGELYAIEAEIRMPAKRRLAERQQKAKPRLKSLESWLREKVKTLSRHSELAKAFTYVLNQWPALAYYTDDGWAEADNNIAENALRMVSLGRKTTCSSVRIMEESGSAAVQPDRDMQTERSGARKLPSPCLTS